MTDITFNIINKLFRKNRMSFKSMICHCKIDIEKTPIITNIPDWNPIEIVRYYDEFTWYYPNCEMQTKRWCVHNIKEDWIVLDCGANVGCYSILFSQLAPKGRIYAVEPTITAKMLEKNLEHNHVKNVVICNEALGEKSGIIKDGIYRIWGEKPEVCKYTFLTIDDFLYQHKITRIDCIKIDVDSYDFDVLKGAEKTLDQFNPWLIVELNHALNKRGKNNMMALEWLARRGYTDALVLDDENFIMQRASVNQKNAKSEKMTLRWPKC
jgi:FkbM family methyltransferase